MDRYREPEPLPRRIELRELSAVADLELYTMIQEIGPGENGFNNGLFRVSYEQYPAEMEKLQRMAKGIDLATGLVPQTIYWMYVDDQPVGYGKLRPHLNEALLQSGGHIGYVIRPQARGNGYGKLLLQGLVEQARERHLDEVLLTCQPDNWPSRRVIEANAGELVEQSDSSCKYKIRIK